MNKRIVVVTAALACASALASAAGAAQMIYKYERPDGSVLYSDAPVPGARLVDRIPVSPATATPAPEGSPPPAPPAPPSAQGDGPAEPPRAQALSGADAEVRAAELAVKNAQERLQAGVEPQSGERIGNAGGQSSRLGEDYFARVKQLEQDLKDALERRDQALVKRNAVR